MQSIFLHGLGQRASSWDQTISLMESQVQAACPDLNELLGGNACTYQNMYHAFSDHCSCIPGPLNLCGLSLGGVLALHYAADHPDKVQSLVLIGAQYKMPRTLLTFQNMIFRLLPKSTFKSIGMTKKQMFGFTKSMMELDFTRQLPGIKSETLVICGEKDKANKKAAAGLADHIPGAQLCLIPDAGHEVNKENPGKLAAVIDKFYRKQGAL